MLNFKDAQKVMKYYGYSAKSVEPILIEKNNKVGIFGTFKTIYGHLSRYIIFNEQEELECFLKNYIKYQELIDNEETYVEFDNYEILSPDIKFKFPEKIETITIDEEVQTLEEKENVEELEIETAGDDDVKLLYIVFDKIEETVHNIENTQNDLQNLIKEYLNKLVELNNKLGRSNEQIATNINLTNLSEYTDRLNELKNKISIMTSEEFKVYFDQAIDLYEMLLMDNTYLDNLYLIECYNEELRRANKMLELYDDYNMNKTKKLFYKKNNQTYEQYLLEHPIEENIVDQGELVEKQKKKVEEKLSEFKNNNVENLKIMYNLNKQNEGDIEPEIILPEPVPELVNVDRKFDFESLNAYYATLKSEEKIKNLLISSPLKELINIIDGISNDKYNTILNEKHFFKKFKEMYDIFSNEDNYSLVKKYFKKIELDSVEEFVQSLIDYTKDFNVMTLDLNENTTLKFKMGILIKKGYLNCSLKKLYPINNKGLNSYYIVNTKIDIPVYFSKKILQLKSDNTLELIKNDDIVTFKIDNYKLVNKDEIEVKDYILKRNEFVLFNEKKYINCWLENGDN